MAFVEQAALAESTLVSSDTIAYVDEAGERGFSKRLTPECDNGVGLFCSLAFPIEPLDEMRARFVPGYARFLEAMSPGAKPHITDAFKSGNEAWAEVARDVRSEFLALIRELELPVIYEARRLRVDREMHEARQTWLDEIKALHRSRIRLAKRPSEGRIEEALMLGLALKLDALCADFDRRRVDILFDETDLADIYRETMDRASSSVGVNIHLRATIPIPKRSLSINP